MRKNITRLLLTVAIILFVIFLWCTTHTKDRFALLKDTRKIPIYCINLPSETKRKQHILDVFGPYVEIVEAVDTRENKWQDYSHYLTEKGIEQMKKSEQTKKREQHYELTPGAIGCFLSHVKCWNKFLDTYPSDEDYVFILEDDTMPAMNFDKTFSKIASDFPPQCDVILCSHLAFGEMKPVEHNGIEYNHLKYYSAFYLLNAYFITARGIKKILKDLAEKENKFYKQLDSYLSELVNENILQVFILKENECFQVGISPTSIQTFVI